MTCNALTVNLSLACSTMRGASTVAVVSLVLFLAGCGQTADDGIANDLPATARAATTSMAATSQQAQNSEATQSLKPGANTADALAGSNDFLPVDEAFKLELSDEGKDVVLVWSIAPDYYLYRHKFKIAGIQAGEAKVALDDAASFSRGLGKTDDYFGHVEVFYNQALARIPRSALGAGSGEIEVQYQGCADAGLCYPVQTRRLALDD